MVRATAASRTPRSLRYALAILLIAAGTAVVFGVTLHFEFLQWGDPEHVTHNPGVLTGSASSIARFWREPYERLYAPVTYTIWAILARAAHVPTPAGGVALSPHLFHAKNLAVHGLNAVLVFHLILVLLGLRALRGGPVAGAAATPVEQAKRRDRRVTLAAVGALVFAVHPIQAEAVSWVTGFMDVLATCFGLGALFHLLVSVAREHTPLDRDAFASATAVPRVLLFARPAAHYAVGLVLLALALLSKPSAVALPLVAAALLCLLPMSPRAFARAIVPWLLLALPVAAIAIRAQGPTEGFETPPLDRPLVAGDAISFYLGKVLAPFRLSPLYNRAPGTLLSHEHIARGALLPLVLGACLVYLWWRRRSPWVFLYAAFVAALLPVLGLVPFAYQERSTVADHYAYLGMAVAGVAVAFGLAAVMNRRGGRGARVALGAGAVVALVGLGALAHAQASIWRTSTDLFRYALVGNPRSVEGRIRLGESYALEGRYAEAEVEFDRALAISPNDARIHSHIGNLKARQGQLAEAAASFQRSIELEPGAAEVRNNLGTTYAQMGDLASATREFAEAVRLDPSMAEAHNNLGQALAMQGRMGEAIEHFRRAVALKPSLTDARANLEQALRQPH